MDINIITIVERPRDVIDAVKDGAIAVYYQDFKAPHSDFHYIVFKESADREVIKRFESLLYRTVLYQGRTVLEPEAADEMRSIVGHQCTRHDTYPIYKFGRWHEDPAELAGVKDSEEKKRLYQSLEIYNDDYRPAS